MRRGTVSGDTGAHAGAASTSDEGPPPSARPFRRVLVVQAVALGVAVVLLTGAMAAQTMVDGPIVAAATWLLLPGLLLYATIHGSLLSGGSGAVGDFLVVVVGSAALWSALYTALHVATSQVARRLSAPGEEGDPRGRRRTRP